MFIVKNWYKLIFNLQFIDFINVMKEKLLKTHKGTKLLMDTYLFAAKNMESETFKICCIIEGFNKINRYRSHRCPQIQKNIIVSKDKHEALSYRLKSANNLQIFYLYDILFKEDPDIDNYLDYPCILKIRKTTNIFKKTKVYTLPFNDYSYYCNMFHYYTNILNTFRIMIDILLNYCSVIENISHLIKIDSVAYNYDKTIFDIFNTHYNNGIDALKDIYRVSKGTIMEIFLVDGYKTTKLDIHAMIKIYLSYDKYVKKLNR